MTPIPDHWATAIADLQGLIAHQQATLDRTEKARAALQADVLRLEGELENSEAHVRLLQSGQLQLSRPANPSEPTMKHVIDVLQKALATRKGELKREIQLLGADPRVDELTDQVSQLEAGILVLQTPVTPPANGADELARVQGLYEKAHDENITLRDQLAAANRTLEARGGPVDVQTPPASESQSVGSAPGNVLHVDGAGQAAPAESESSNNAPAATPAPEPAAAETEKPKTEAPPAE